MACFAVKLWLGVLTCSIIAASFSQTGPGFPVLPPTSSTREAFIRAGACGARPSGRRAEDSGDGDTKVMPAPDGNSAQPAAPRLARRLGLFDATMIVMGGIVGSGIFINPYVVARQVHTSFLDSRDDLEWTRHEFGTVSLSAPQGGRGGRPVRAAQREVRDDGRARQILRDAAKLPRRHRRRHRNSIRRARTAGEGAGRARESHARERGRPMMTAPS